MDERLRQLQTRNRQLRSDLEVLSAEIDAHITQTDRQSPPLDDEADGVI